MPLPLPAPPLLPPLPPPRDRVTFIQDPLVRADVPAYPSCIIVRCEHGWRLQAGVATNSESKGLCQLCAPTGVHWHLLPEWAMSCPHGFYAPPQLRRDPPPRWCRSKSCRHAAEELQELATDQRELPLREGCIRWPGEIDMRAYNAATLFKEEVATPFQAVAFHEHTGAFRDHWAARGVRAASVADRPTLHPPAPSSRHFISGVIQWHRAYPHPIPIATANPDCQCACMAAPSVARERQLKHLLSGALSNAIVHFVWSLFCAHRVAVEQPATLLEHVVRSPDQKARVADYGQPRHKDWWWWLMRLQVLSLIHI